MQFRDFVARRTHQQVATQLGLSRSHVSQLVSVPPKRTPSVDVMHRILLIANGEITADELIAEFIDGGQHHEKSKTK